MKKPSYFMAMDKKSDLDAAKEALTYIAHVITERMKADKPLTKDQMRDILVWCNNGLSLADWLEPPKD